MRNTRLLGCALLWGAAAIHAAVVPQHLVEWHLAGVFFIGLALTEAALGTAFAVTPRPSIATTVVVVSVATVSLWLVSRSTGLPFGPDPEVPEPIGVPDTLASVAESLTVVVLAAWLRAEPVGPSAAARRSAVSVEEEP